MKTLDDKPIIRSHSIRKIINNIMVKKRKVFKTNSMPFLQLHITDHCNLNCKGCAHFSPVSEVKYINLDEMELMYKKLIPILENNFSLLELMGGEPLLHPQIEEIIILTRKYFPNIEIRLVTNGIKLFNMKESFFQACSQYNIAIYISRYPIKLNYVSLTKMLDSYQVKHDSYGNYDEDKMFIEYKVNPKGNGDIRYNYRNCEFGGRCLQLKDSKIYPCFISAYANQLNKYFGMNFEWEKDDYLSLDDNLTKEKISRFINEPVPFCRYCTMKNNCLSKWEVSKRSKQEWIDLE